MDSCSFSGALMYTLVSRWTAEHNVTFQAFHTNQRLHTGSRGVFQGSAIWPKLQCGSRGNVDGIGDLTDLPKFGNGSKIGKEYDIRNSRMKAVQLQNSREKGAGMRARPGPNFPDPIQSKGWSHQNAMSLSRKTINNYHSKQIFLSFHWPRAHHVTCK